MLLSIEAIHLNQRELGLDTGRLKLRLPSGSTKLQSAPPAKPLGVSDAQATQHVVSDHKRIKHSRNPDHHDRDNQQPNSQ